MGTHAALCHHWSVKSGPSARYTYLYTQLHMCACSACAPEGLGKQGTGWSDNANRLMYHMQARLIWPSLKLQSAQG